MQVKTNLNKNESENAILRSVQSVDAHGNTWEMVLFRVLPRYRFEVRINKCVIGKGVNFTALDIATMYWEGAIRAMKPETKEIPND